MNTLEVYDTEFAADSVEWCPIAGFHDYFLCGTYQLCQETSQNNSVKRLGILFLFQVAENSKLKLIQRVEVPAILDIKWAHVKCCEKIIFGMVNSLGYLQIWEFMTEDNTRIDLLIEQKVQQEDVQNLALSLDWNKLNTLNESCDDLKQLSITVSDSRGYISLFSLDENNLSLIAFQKPHDLEAWITAFDYWNPNTIYSGADDCKLKVLDLRLDLQTVGCTKDHEAGVTSLHSNAAREYCLASGSYDDVVRMWDTRNFKEPISKTNLEGGIWRLKWDPFYHRYLLAACMHSGFKVVDCDNMNCPKVTVEYTEHESIAYGCDWSFESQCNLKLPQPHDSTDKLTLTATCSFYDHNLRLSSTILNNKSTQ